MSKATEKVDRFLERYRQLCLEEGLCVNSRDEQLLLWITTDDVLEDNISQIRNKTIEDFDNGWHNRKWRELDSDKAGTD